MKTITLIQPWATLIALGEKQIETRSWPTKYRGQLAIHAGKKIDKTVFDDPFYKDVFSKHNITIENIPTSSIIATCELYDCVPTEQLVSTVSDKEMHFGNYTPSRYGWLLKDINQLDTPIHAKGMLGLWNYN